MKKKWDFKYILKYLATIFSWALFVILLTLAVFLIYYFVSVKIINKGKTSVPLSIYTIVSESMVPTINKYDVIINLQYDSPKDVEVGDVITFISTSWISAGKTVTHRVVDIQIINGEYYYTTKGDNNPIQDSSSAGFKNVIGQAVIRLPQLGRIQAFVASKFGWLVVVIIPAMYVIIKDVAKLIKLKNLQKAADKENAEKRSKQNYSDNLEEDDIIDEEKGSKDGRKRHNNLR